MTIELLGHEVFIDVDHDANVSIREAVANIRDAINAGESDGPIFDRDGDDVGAWNIC